MREDYVSKQNQTDDLWKLCQFYYRRITKFQFILELSWKLQDHYGNSGG